VRLRLIVLAGSLMLSARALMADTVPPQPEPGPPKNYVAAFLGTTLAYRPPGGPWGGFQHDATPLAGYGRYVSPTIALELDLGPTFVKGEYSSFGLVPAVVWSFSPHAYAAARFVLPVDPETNFAVFPGIGVIHTFKSGLSPILEVNLVSYLGKGDPDFGIAVTAGVLFSF
jgi:hypothetical protein